MSITLLLNHLSNRLLCVLWHYEKGVEECFALLLFALENAFSPASSCDLVLKVAAVIEVE